jgi:hypothetical protein
VISDFVIFQKFSFSQKSKLSPETETTILLIIIIGHLNLLIIMTVTTGSTSNESVISKD